MLLNCGCTWRTASGLQYVKHAPTLIAQLVKNPPAMQETLVQFLGQEDMLEKG